MILVRNLTDTFGENDKQHIWVEHADAADVDGLIADMEKAMSGDENFAPPRAYEVMEVEVKRTVKVERAVVHTVEVVVTKQ